MTDDELYDAFTSTSLPADQFHHEQHVPVAWLFVCRHHMPAAIGEFSEAIKRFAAAKGAHGLYHETITWAFLLIIGARAGVDWNVGVLSGAHRREALELAPHTHLLQSVAELPGLW